MLFWLVALTATGLAIWALLKNGDSTTNELATPPNAPTDRAQIYINTAGQLEVMQPDGTTQVYVSHQELTDGSLSLNVASVHETEPNAEQVETPSFIVQPLTDEEPGEWHTVLHNPTTNDFRSVDVLNFQAPNGHLTSTRPLVVVAPGT